MDDYQGVMPDTRMICGEGFEEAGSLQSAIV